MPTPNTQRVTCPRCAVSAISPDSGTCDVCGFRLDAPVAVERAELVSEMATRQLAHEFDIVDVLGRRDGSVVLRAIERNGGRTVLVKVVERRTEDPEAEPRFRTLMDAYAHLDHPHLVPVLRHGKTDSLLWYSMPDVDARPLRMRLRDVKCFDVRATRRIATQLVSVLEYLHRNGVVHGAVKPENVLFDDNGWAWLAEPSFTRVLPPRRRISDPKGMKVITSEIPIQRPAWLAPEDMGRIERLPTSDQFSLAALLFECVTGEPPLTPGEQVVRFRADVPAGMSQAISRALDAQPWRRFPSCAEFLVALEQVNGTQTAGGARPSGRMSTGALLIHDWEPPVGPAAPKRSPVRFVLPAIVLIAMAVAIPPLVTKFKAARAPQPMVSSPSVLPAPTASLGEAPPSAMRAGGDLATEPPPATTPAARRPSAPSSIPRSSTSSAPRPQQQAPTSTAPAPAAAAPATAAPAGAATGAMARLTINASPWGQVFIDDKLVGNTPRANLEVTAGEHTIRVSRDGFSTFTRTVRLQAGETLRITDIVLTPIAP